MEVGGQGRWEIWEILGDRSDDGFAMVRDRERERTEDYTEVIGYMLISHCIKACGKSSKYFGICLVTF